MEDMKMVDQSKVEKALETVWPLVSPNGVNGMQGQMQVLLDGQAELLQETQKIATAWTKRHQEAMEAGLQTFQTMCSSKDPGAITAAYTAFLSNSMKAFLADINDSREEALRLAQIGQKSVAALFQHSAAAQAQLRDTPSSSRQEAKPSEPRTAWQPQL
jgi:hypothetical protein